MYGFLFLAYAYYNINIIKYIVVKIKLYQYGIIKLLYKVNLLTELNMSEACHNWDIDFKLWACRIL